LNILKYLTVKYDITTFNGNKFDGLTGFYSSCNASYYVVDNGAKRVHILNDDWSYVSYKNFSNPNYIIKIDSSLYLTGNTNIWKLDKDLNILIQYTSTGIYPNYRGIYYNSSNRFIYVAPMSLTEILVFNLNLIFNHSISISSYTPYSITEYNNKLYVGTTNGTIFVIQNEVIINQFNGCNGASVWVIFIIFDQYGYVATLCSISKLYLYNSNGTYTGNSLSTPKNPRYIGFDTKGRFVLISQSQVFIYN
jgi:hypothetical protein